MRSSALRMKLNPGQCHRYGRMIEGVERWLDANFPDLLLGHLIMFATDYGRDPAPRSQWNDVLARIDSYFARPVIKNNPDLCAERLLIESMLSPIDPAICLAYADHLHTLQQSDGGFGKADIDSHNHTVAVAAVALGWLVETHC